MYGFDQVEPRTSDDALEALRKKLTRPERRQPELTVETYALGHYEQMVVAKALAYATTIEPLQREAYRLTESERADLAALQHIFGSHATVVVTRVNQED